MKIIQIGDLHVSETRLKEFEIIIRQISDKIISLSPDFIVFSGDMFVTRDRLTPNQVELARKLFKEYLKDYKIFMITGNHDISLNSEKIDSISAVFSYEKSSNVEIFTCIGSYKDIENYRLHFFSYPEKAELIRLGVKDISQLYKHKILDEFKIDPSKRNILVFHGTMEDFTKRASEESLGVGKDLIIPRSFWSKFDAVMAGHLHEHQSINNAVYNGAPVPLTYADEFSTGIVLWNDLKFEFIEIPQLFPYITIDIGDLSLYGQGLTDEAERRVKNDYSYENARVRVKYIINSERSNELDHSVISKYFKSAIEVKISPTYTNDIGEQATVSFDDFKHHTIYDLIESYIDNRKYHPRVKEIAKEVEKRIKDKYSFSDPAGIHFKLNTLSISNFKCFGENNLVIDFNKLYPVVGIFGQNKSGKSSLIEAIIWSLFGTTIRNKTVDSVIRNGEESVRVELTFNSNNNEYKIIRERGKPTNLRFFTKKDDWVDVSGGTANQTQKSIERLVGTFDMFVATVYSPQNSIDLLVKKRPDERKQIILDCLQIDVIENRSKEVTELRKEYRDKLNLEKGRLNAYSDEISMLINSNPTETIEKFEDLIKREKIELSRHQTHLTSLSKKLFEYEDLRTEYDQVCKKIIDLRSKIEKIQTVLEEKRAERTKYQRALVDYSAINDGIQKIEELEKKVKEYIDENNLNVNRRSKIKDLEVERATINEAFFDRKKTLDDSRNTILSSIDGLSLLDCSKADCPINSRIGLQRNNFRIKLDEIDTSLKNIEGEFNIKLNSVSNKIARLNEELQVSFYHYPTHKSYERDLQKERDCKWYDLKNKLSSGEDLLSSLVELIAAYENQREAYKNEMDMHVNQRTEIAKKIGTIDNYKKEVEKVKLDVEKYTENINLYNNQVFKAKNSIEDINNLQKKILFSQEQIKSLEDYILYCNKYSEIVSKQGVLYAVVDRAIPIIEKFAQNILSETTNGMISINMDSYKTLQSGSRTEEVAIRIKDEKGVRDVTEGSGSEIVLVSIALRAAMVNLLSLRMGSKVELMIIDESFGVFDQNTILSVKHLLKTLSKKFNRLLFITHVPELKDAADTKITVHSENLVSKYKIEGEICQDQ